MKRVKFLGLVAVAASALMAFAGTASADVLTSPTGTIYTGKFTAQSLGHAVLHIPPGKLECASKFEATVTQHGPGKTVTAHINSLSFNACTSGWHTTVVTAGDLSIHGITGTYNGDLYWTGGTVEATNPNLGNITCRYATNNTTIGTVTGGSPATLDISASIPFHSGSIFCGTGTTAWTGNYQFTSPTPLYVDTT